MVSGFFYLSFFAEGFFGAPARVLFDLAGFLAALSVFSVEAFLPSCFMDTARLLSVSLAVLKIF